MCQCCYKRINPRTFFALTLLTGLLAVLAPSLETLDKQLYLGFSDDTEWKWRWNKVKCSGPECAMEFINYSNYYDENDCDTYDDGCDYSDDLWLLIVGGRAYVALSVVGVIAQALSGLIQFCLCCKPSCYDCGCLFPCILTSFSILSFMSFVGAVAAWNSCYQYGENKFVILVNNHLQKDTTFIDPDNQTGAAAGVTIAAAVVAFFTSCVACQISYLRRSFSIAEPYPQTHNQPLINNNFNYVPEPIPQTVHQESYADPPPPYSNFAPAAQQQYEVYQPHPQPYSNDVYAPPEVVQPAYPEPQVGAYAPGVIQPAYPEPQVMPNAPPMDLRISAAGEQQINVHSTSREGER